MKKRISIKFNLIILLTVLLLYSFFMMGFCKKEYVVYNIPENIHFNANYGNATQIDDNTLLEISTLDGLELNFTKLPIVTVNTDYDYVIEGEDGVDRGRPQVGDSDAVQQPIRSVTFTGLPYDQNVDIEVEAKFENCGTLNDKAIDVVIKYTDFYSASKYTGTSSYYQARNNSKVLWWTAYGTMDAQTGNNEWFQRGFECINMKVYFYYHGESTPIPLNVAYFTLYSEDGSTTHAEAASSRTATQIFLFEETTMAYQASGTYGSRTYNNIFYGTATHEDSSPKKAAVSFKYQNTDCVDVDMHILLGTWSAGYHVNFYALSATLPGEPVKSVSSEEVNAGDELVYTISQCMPTATDGNFKLSTLSVSDELMTDGITYKSLKVYNDSGGDITSSAGTTKFSDNTLTYDFNSSYLSSLTYTGQEYRFVITVDVNENPTINQIDNYCTTLINNASKLTSNIVQTEIVSTVKVNYIDEDGKEIHASEEIKGKILEEYTTTPLEIEKYDLITTPENANGEFDVVQKEVTYVYRKNVKDIEIYKVWDDNNFANRPISINIIVSSSEDKQTQVFELNSENGWYYKISDVDRFDDATDEEIVYTVEEENVPEGYYISSNVQVGNIYTITNTKYGSMIITNVDYLTKDPLSLTKYIIEKEENGTWVKVDEYETNDSGQIELENLEYGKYKITEIKASEGYKLNTNTYEVELNSTQRDYNVEIPSKQSAVLPEAGGAGNNLFKIGIIVIIIGFIVTKLKSERRSSFRHKY